MRKSIQLSGRCLVLPGPRCGLIRALIGCVLLQCCIGAPSYSLDANQLIQDFASIGGPANLKALQDMRPGSLKDDTETSQLFHLIYATYEAVLGGQLSNAQQLQILDSVDRLRIELVRSGEMNNKAIALANILTVTKTTILPLVACSDALSQDEKTHVLKLTHNTANLDVARVAGEVSKLMGKEITTPPHDLNALVELVFQSRGISKDPGRGLIDMVLLKAATKLKPAPEGLYIADELSLISNAFMLIRNETETLLMCAHILKEKVADPLDYLHGADRLHLEVYFGSPALSDDEKRVVVWSAPATAPRDAIRATLLNAVGMSKAHWAEMLGIPQPQTRPTVAPGHKRFVGTFSDELPSRKGQPADTPNVAPR